MLAHSDRIEQTVSAAVQSVSEFNREISGSVTLGTGATACIHLLPPLLQKLHQDHPLLTVRVTVGNTLEVVRAIEENRLDLGLCTLPANGRNLAVTPVLNEEFVCIFSDGQDELSSPLTPEILQSLPLIAFEAGSGTRDLIDGWFRHNGLMVVPVMQLGSIEAIKRMVRAGLGYSIVPRMAVEHPQDSIGLKVQSLTPLLYRQLGVVMRQDKIISKGIAELLRLLPQIGC